MAGNLVGLDMKAYFNSASYATPTWVLIATCRDVTLDMSRGTADLSRRGSTWRRNRGTLKEGTVSMEIIYDTADAAYDKLSAAFLAGTIVDITLADGTLPTGPAEYFRSEYEVTGFSRNEPLEDAVTISVELTIAATVNEPNFVTVP